jgi:hypothetical protein
MQGNERKEGVIMRKKTRVIVALILNLFPELGICFSGTAHSLKWLRFLGCGLAASFLLIIPFAAVILYTPLINHHFTTSELILPSAIALVSRTLGTGVEQKLNEQKENNNP